jgi:hypothetical protein
MDIKNHSSGIWRSLIIYDEAPQIHIRNTLKPIMDEEGYPYAYSYYAEIVNNKTGEVVEKAHITYRILFENDKKMREFIEAFWVIAKVAKWEYEFRSYDHERWVKWAYVLGTRMAEEEIKVIKETKKYGESINISPEFRRLAFHGYMNIMVKTYREEFLLIRFMQDGIMDFVINPERWERILT